MANTQAATENADTSFMDGAPTFSYGATTGEAPVQSSEQAAPAQSSEQQEASVSMSALLAELLGTFVLVFTVQCAVASPAPAEWAATAIALVLMAMIYATGPVSGGNLNPAVSLALAMSGKISHGVMLQYWSMQLLGGLLGAQAGKSICAPNNAATVEVKAPFELIHGVFAEVLYTAMLCFVVLSCAASRRNNPKDDPNQFFAVAIGFVIVAGGYAVGGVSGAAFNPAVAIGLGMASEKGSGLVLQWSAAELLGSLIGTTCFRILRAEEFYDIELDDETLATYVPEIGTRCMSEALGTFILVVTVGLNIVTGPTCTAFSAAAALMCMVYSLGSVSGAHLNPAVTTAIVLSGRGKCDMIDGLAYMCSQLLGSMCAAFVMAKFHASSNKAT
eukprot:TRINITY_DN1131_c0_g2_i1.p1 TRINITY_DN1131_c0_g2~~TRINITY_DN1131_c0_g2_i1.p1  ORF type:complete len:389 (-),score=81.48 TRINITY_DN1131_c0_g2_i1:577-1743(-)